MRSNESRQPIKELSAAAALVGTIHIDKEEGEAMKLNCNELGAAIFKGRVQGEVSRGDGGVNNMNISDRGAFDQDHCATGVLFAIVAEDEVIWEGFDKKRE